MRIPFLNSNYTFLAVDLLVSGVLLFKSFNKLTFGAPEQMLVYEAYDISRDTSVYHSFKGVNIEDLDKDIGKINQHPKRKGAKRFFNIFLFCSREDGHTELYDKGLTSPLFNAIKEGNNINQGFDALKLVNEEEAAFVERAKKIYVLADMAGKQAAEKIKDLPNSQLGQQVRVDSQNQDIASSNFDVAVKACALAGLCGLASAFLPVPNNVNTFIGAIGLVAPVCINYFGKSKYVEYHPNAQVHQNSAQI